MANMNVYQQVFALSLMSNLAQKYKGTQADIQAALEKGLPRALRYLPGPWEIVWGPAVWKNRPEDAESGPDHVWFVARNPELQFADGQKQDTYVLAIAATASAYNWIMNNIDVDRVVDFNQWVGGWASSQGVTEPKPADSITSDKAYISHGTAAGIYRLASVAPPMSAVAGGIPLRSFWAGFSAASQAKIITTGHSLGGALSPTLALALLESQAFTNFSPENILTYPTAGPSPGNLAFAKLFSERFPKVSKTPGLGYEVWNCNLVNRLDIVSQAWCTNKKASSDQNMENILTIYGPAPFWLVLAIKLAMGKANQAGVGYCPLQARMFTGKPPTVPPTDLEGLKRSVRHQHVQVFLDLFDIAIPQTLTGEEHGVQSMTSDELEHTRPVMNMVMATNSLLSHKNELPDEDEDYSAITNLSDAI